MPPFKKFIFLILPLSAGVLFFILFIVYDQEKSLKGLESLIGLFVILLGVNLVIYRLHVSRNTRLGPDNRIRSMRAVTLFGPLGQLGYYGSHIHPFGPSDPPPSGPPIDVPRTDADDYIGL